MQWWRYDPDRSRWRKCSEAEGRALLATESRMGAAGEAKVACVDERLDLDIIGRMRRPVIYAGEKANTVLRSQICNSPTLFALLGGAGLKLFACPYIEPDAVYIVDEYPFNPEPNPTWPYRWRR